MQKVISCVQDLISEFKNPFLEELFSHISHGKMLRSRLVMAITPETQKSILLCSIIELIQLASLLHDDVIDESSMRRGKASINHQFDNKSAIMLGDALYSKAFYHLCSFSSDIAKSLSNAVCRLSSGEIYDVFLSKNFNPSIEQYLLMIEEKTASLIASSAECAAILSNEDKKAYFHYGKCLGIAFQIIDDILDITQPQEVLGKPAMSDFKEGKTTLPYILLFEQLNEEEKKKLQMMFKRELSQIEKDWILQKMKEHKSIELSQAKALEFADSALKYIPNHLKLKEIIDSMIYRSF